MLTYVPPLALRDQHVEWLLASERAKPVHEQRSAAELVELVNSQQMLVFELRRKGGGIVAVGKVGRRLVLHALTAPGFGWSFRAAVKLLKKLASDLECDAVETMVWDRRLARAMQRVGVQPEAVQMVLKVAGG